MLRFRKEIRRRRFGRGRLRSRRGGVGPGPTLRECSLPLHFRHLANLVLFARTNDDQQSQGGKSDPLPQRKSHKRRQSKVHFTGCARRKRGGKRQTSNPENLSGQAAQRSTFNVQFRIQRDTKRNVPVDRPLRGRCYGRSGEAAHFERLRRCCLTSRSELAIHRLFV